MNSILFDAGHFVFLEISLSFLPGMQIRYLKLFDLSVCCVYGLSWEFEQGAVGADYSPL